MPTIQEELAQLEESFTSTVAGITTERELRESRAKTFGKVSPFTQILRRMSEVPAASKRELGETINESYRRMGMVFNDRLREIHLGLV